MINPFIINPLTVNLLIIIPHIRSLSRGVSIFILDFGKILWYNEAGDEDGKVEKEKNAKISKFRLQ